MKIVFSLLTIFLVCSACGNNPKVIYPNSESKVPSATSTNIFSDDPIKDSKKRLVNKEINKDMHTVVIKEILPTEKYVYLLVEENQEEFWVATSKQEVQVGAQYFFRGGLLKTNFESKEYGRTFDKVYLVSKLVSVDHSEGSNLDIKTKTASSQNSSSNQKVKQKTEHPEGYTKISDLISNPEKYEGTEVLLAGTCVKVNPNIMGRNWIHLQDGTQDDYDLVVTSNIPVPEGHAVKLKGIVVLDKDFGAGYRYEILVENAQLILNK